MASHFSVFLPDDQATTKLGQHFARNTPKGTGLLLKGDIGTGKTHFARAFIQAFFNAQIDVPSPTFTLIQHYEHPACTLWHADLYRLSHPDELYELGLEAAFANDICLIEWPDRLGHDLPQRHIMLEFSYEQTGRQVQIITDGNYPWLWQLT